MPNEHYREVESLLTRIDWQLPELIWNPGTRYRQLEEEIKTVGLKPSPAKYQSILELVRERSTSLPDRIWAATEIERIQPAVERGYW